MAEAASSSARIFSDAVTTDKSQPNLRHLSQDLSENSQDTIWISILVVASFLLVISAFLTVAYRHVSKYHHKVPETPVALNVKSRSATRGCFAPLIENQQEDPITNMNSNNNHKEAGAHELLPSYTIERVHVIILVHGWLGCPQDLGYIHHAMEREAAAIAAENDENTTENDTKKCKEAQKHEPFVIHTCAANNNRTNDGIQTGADRISVEIQGVFDRVLEKYHGDTSTLKEITFSMLGFSLGGLYARVALPQIIPPTQYRSTDNDQSSLPKFTPKLFCTMATPHLGSLRHTYLHLPSFFIRPITSLVPTGRDLFLHTPLLQQSVTDPQWTEPLLQFEKRIAYTNTFSVDMMVPTTTAAFLSKDGGAEHHVVQMGSHKEHPHMALVVETKAQHEIFLRRSEDDGDSDDMDDNNNIDMAHRLDAMGWTKVFVDYTDSFRLPPNQTKLTYRSAELISAFHGRRRRHFFHLPNGHDLMPVNSKNAFMSYANRKGRPLVDQMATDFIRDVVHGPSSSLS